MFRRGRLTQNTDYKMLIHNVNALANVSHSELLCDTPYFEIQPSSIRCPGIIKHEGLKGESE